MYGEIHDGDGAKTGGTKMIKTIKVSAKGIMTIPAVARKKFDIQPKSLVNIEIRDGELVIRPLRLNSGTENVLHGKQKRV
jgi:AbrB family looped-hinge helix DNA binding protein